MKKESLYYFFWFNFIFAFISVAFLFTVNASKDYAAYQLAYGHTGRFEIGYTYVSLWLSGFIDFKIFWSLLLFVQAFLITMIYYREKSIIFLPLSLAYVADNVYGSQVRWGIASLLFILYIKYNIRLSALISFSFHSAGILFPIAKVIGLFSKSRTYLFVIFFLGYYISDYLISYILDNTIYAYYLGSEFLQSRSVLSIIYSVFVILAVQLVKSSKCNNNVRILDFMFYANLLSLIYWKYAIISGRLIDATMILEPFLMMSLFKNRSHIGILFFALFSLLLIVRLALKVGYIG